MYILSGAEDLVPILGADGARIEDLTTDPQFTIHRYRPRIEGLFARIERWTRHGDGDVHWRTLSRDNVLTLYGKDANARIADPDDARRIFSWLICESRDDRGNAIVYEYKPEDGEGADLAQAHERNRGPRDRPSRAANRYLKRIRYGNRTPLLDGGGRRPRHLSPAALQGVGWMFEVVVDYGEHDAAAPLPDGAGPWLFRNDPFSAYRAGFELRTCRLAQRILMFHHFPGEPGVGANCLVRSTDFVYAERDGHADDRRRGGPILSLLASVVQTGYKRVGNGYAKRSLPPLEFGYSKAVVGEEVRDVDALSIENLPDGANGSTYRWIDLDGEGLTGVLAEQTGGWTYKRNESPLTGNVATDSYAPRFAPAERAQWQPGGGFLAGGRQFLDLDGNGMVDLVTLERPVAGFQARTRDATGWAPFRAFSSMPNVAWSDPNLRFIDLTGDGRADILVTEDEAFTWYPSRAREGFGPASTVGWNADEERGPRVVFSEGAQTISLADMSGDGLTDIVRIRNGEVCYWPNLGHGRFGAKVTMDDAPWFDNPDQFDADRIRLVDIDGSGMIDVIYLGRRLARFWSNCSGNSWSKATELTGFPAVDDIASVTAVDLLGNGTGCLVWASPLPANSRRPMKYLGLMADGKPNLLVSSRNNLGAETLVQYAPSTWYYLRDKYAGMPWVTRLPFPVHVVDRVETLDRVSRNRFVTRYAYHHGYFDGAEREFRGFGMVEQFDTEEMAALSAGDAFPEAVNVDAASHVPPIHTKTWFHTGAFFDGERIVRQYLNEYFRDGRGAEDFAGADTSALLPDAGLPMAIRHQDGTETPWTLSADEVREACRALKGAMLRQEVYAQDGSELEERPYSIAERNYTIELLQPRHGNPHAVFLTHAREAVDLQCERKLYDVGGEKRADPRIGHSLTLETDGFGNVLSAAAVAYGRRHPDPDPLLTPQDRLKQSAVHVTCTESRYTNAIEGSDDYRAPAPAEARTYEILRISPDAVATDAPGLFDIDELRAKLQLAGDGGHDVPYEDVGGESATQDHPYRRLIECQRSLFRRDDLSGSLALGKLEPRALPFESHRLAFTPGLVKAAYVDTGKLPDAQLNALLEGEGGYIHSGSDAGWWIPSGRVFFHPDPAATSADELAEATRHYFLPRRFRDPFGNDTIVRHDAYDLLGLETEDALGNKVTSGERDALGQAESRIDYRTLGPQLVTDPNGNRAEVAIDILGRVVGTAVMGKRSESLGDSLQGFVADLEQAQIDAFFADPLGQAEAVLGGATTRIVIDAERGLRAGNPAIPGFVASVARETHLSDLQANESFKVQVGTGFSDGFGREIQRKVQAAPGPLIDGGPPVSLRWVGSGWTIFNNKGKPVRQYEPYFSATHDFEFANATGVSPIIFYDPLGRVVGTLRPDHAFEKVAFDPWRQSSWDANDTVTLDPASDPDIGRYVSRLPPHASSPTWAQLRTDPAFAAQAVQRWPDPARRSAESDAAAKAAAHAQTPAIAYFDTLGRIFMTVADNGAAGKHVSRSELDIEGNQRSVTDALGRKVMIYGYDMLGNRNHQASMEAGKRTMLNDAMGKGIRAWDDRGHQFRSTYDTLHRPTESFVRVESGTEKLVGRTVYGESEPNAADRNLRGKVVQAFDQAGVVTNDQYDFKGNSLRVQRQLATDYKSIVDWAAAVALEPRLYVGETRYDALNRAIRITAPDGSVISPEFNEANLLKKMSANLRGAVDATPFVTGIDHNAKGQRIGIDYGNGARTSYSHDRDTFRLTGIRTTRGSDNAKLQDFTYAYDPVGNITAIGDGAQDTVYFNNQAVTAANQYVYDALYRLISANGREHVGQLARPASSWNDEFRVHQPQPGDGQAMRRYTEHYEYDPVGNFQRLIHQAANGNWTRTYTYDESSPLEPALRSNRLTSTRVGDDPIEAYAHDAHGNMTGMAHLPVMEWNFVDQLRATQRQAGDATSSERTWYVYDSSGQRVRKVTDRANGSRRKERIYVGGFEVYREYGGTGDVTLERESLPMSDGTTRIALVETRTQGSDDVAARVIRYQFGNHLGSASLELDDAAHVISYEEYHPYGSTSYQAGRSVAETSLKRYRYTGKERDEETGFTYHGARYYAPWLGRWTQCDPSGLQAGLNMYLYCRSQPIRFVDPNGLQDSDDYLDYLGGASCEDPNAPMSSEWHPEDEIECLDPNAPVAPPAPIVRLQTPVAPPARKLMPDDLYVGPGAIQLWYQDAWKDATNENAPLDIRITSGAQAVLLALGGVQLDMIGQGILNIPYDIAKGGEEYGRAATTQDPDDALHHGLEGAKHLTFAAGSFSTFEGFLASLESAPLRTRPIPVELTGPDPSVASRGMKYTFDGKYLMITKNVEGAYSFTTVTDSAAIKQVAQQLETKNPGAAVYIGSGGHGTGAGTSFISDANLVDRKFIIQDQASLKSLQDLGVGKVLDLTDPVQLQIFKNAEQMSLVPGQDTVFTIRGWCYSARTGL